MRLSYSRFSKSPWGAVLQVCLVVLGGELLIMIGIGWIFKPLIGEGVSSAFWEFMDPLLLTILVAPTLYFAVLRPLRTQQQLLEEQRDELGIAAVTFDSQEGVVVTDEGHKILRVNQAFTTVTGYASEEAVGKTLAILHSERHSPEFYRHIQDALQRDGHWQGEIWSRRKNGEAYPESRTITAVRGTHGKINYVSIFSDITLRKAYEEKIRFLAFHDSLTGLASRELLYERLSQALSQARRKYERLALLFMDLDGFKAVNDNHGHEAGDELLRTVAGRVQLCIRDEDTAARIGGDEFAIVLGGIEEAENATPVAKKLIEKLGTPIRLPDGRECVIGVSIGIAIFPDDGAELDKLMSAADSAMYQSKAKGRNTYTYSNEKMRKGGQWVELDSSYLFGVEEIDRQHHELADMLNKLNAAVQHNQPEEVVAGLFHEFIGKIQIHFEAEERLMEQHVQDMHGMHKKEHQRLIGEVARLRENLSRGAELAVLQSLKDWLLGHVKGLDRQLSEALLQRGVR